MGEALKDNGDFNIDRDKYKVFRLAWDENDTRVCSFLYWPEDADLNDLIAEMYSVHERDKQRATWGFNVYGAPGADRDDMRDLAEVYQQKLDESSSDEDEGWDFLFAVKPNEG